jgi:hypothetical protein
VGEQKGVDSLIVTDMITLARNRAISDAVLVSGDEDLRVGVQQAQEFGVRVHLVGIKPSRGSQSLFLLQEADTTHEWTAEDISVFLRCQASQPVPEASSTSSQAEPILAESEDPLKTVPARVAGTLAPNEIEALVEAVERGEVPRDIDARLLSGARSAIGRDLNPAEKKAVRKNFLDACRARM